MTDTVLVDGYDLSTIATLNLWEGVHAAAPLVGELPRIPNRDGRVDSNHSFDALDFPLGLILQGGSPDITGFNDKYRLLKSKIKPGRLVTLTRRLTFTTGSEDHTAPARYTSGLQPSQMSPADYGMVIHWDLLSGYWQGPATALASTPRGVQTSVTVAGDVRTCDMTITLSGSSGGAIAFRNDTNGAYFTYNGATTGTAVVIDVLNQTAMQGATDVTEHLSWTGDEVWQLEAGVNSVQFYGGAVGSTVAVSYKPSWL